MSRIISTHLSRFDVKQEHHNFTLKLFHLKTRLLKIWKWKKYLNTASASYSWTKQICNNWVFGTLHQWWVEWLNWSQKRGKLENAFWAGTSFICHHFRDQSAARDKSMRKQEWGQTADQIWGMDVRNITLGDDDSCPPYMTLLTNCVRICFLDIIRLIN